MNIEFLLLLLRDIERMPDYPKDDNNIILRTDELIQGVIVYANHLLFTSDFQCNWYNIDILQREGFNVYPGEIDEIGWVTGYIETKKGIIVYG